MIQWLKANWRALKWMWKGLTSVDDDNSPTLEMMWLEEVFKKKKQRKEIKMKRNRTVTVECAPEIVEQIIAEREKLDRKIDGQYPSIEYLTILTHFLERLDVLLDEATEEMD